MASARFKMPISSATFFFFLFMLILHNSSGFSGTIHLQKRNRNNPSIALNLERIQLLKDALGWMTFRKNGELMTDAQLETLFFKTLRKKYAHSKFYRTFVIAFQKGVLPRLTLQKDDPCDPDYTRKYKNPFNSSVTWHFQKKFTFESYDKRSSGEFQFCDYRQGLICKPSTRTCGCPDGAMLQPIAKGSVVERCLLQENEICALIDIGHGNDPNHSALASNLYHLIFNLEKPPSCKMGTQCRYKQGIWTHPLCYDVNDGPWDPPRPMGSISITIGWTISLGDECTLGLYANPGSCVTPSSVGVFPGYICYNFGPPRSTSPSAKENRTGFCAHESGSLGISNEKNMINNEIHSVTLFTSFVHPRTVPLRGGDLRAFYIKCLSIYDNFFTSGDWDVQVEKEGERCSVSKTETMENAWRYFAGLEDAPPPGQDYVVGANKEELESKLQSMVDLTSNFKQKVCMVWKDKWRDGLKCVAEAPADSDGNDGKCQKPGKLNTNSFADKWQYFLDTLSTVEKELAEEETAYRKDILVDNPEVKCARLTSDGTLERYCGRDMLRECTENNVCQCLEGTEPRMVTVRGREYTSDYCYFPSGSCDRDVTQFKQLNYTASEIKGLVDHYGDVDDGCGMGNVCVFLDKVSMQCTTRNTGHTAFGYKPEGGGGAGGSGWREVGGASDLHGSKITTGLSLGCGFFILTMLLKLKYFY